MIDIYMKDKWDFGIISSWSISEPKVIGLEQEGEGNGEGKKNFNLTNRNPVLLAISFIKNC